MKLTVLHDTEQLVVLQQHLRINRRVSLDEKQVGEKSLAHLSKFAGHVRRVVCGPQSCIPEALTLETYLADKWADAASFT